MRSIIKGKVERELYRYDEGWSVCKYNRVVGWKDILTNIDLPEIDKGSIFLTNMDMVVEIIRIAIDTEGRRVYFVNKVVEVLRDEITEQSRREAEMEESMYLEPKPGEKERAITSIKDWFSGLWFWKILK